MIITCPACSARYSVDPAKLGEKGRRVRCASCGHSWQQMPPAPAETPAPEDFSAEEPADTGGSPDPVPATTAHDAPGTAVSGGDQRRDFQVGAMARQRHPSTPRPGIATTDPSHRHRRTSPAMVLLWFLVLGALIAGGGYMARDQIVETWPPASQLYAQLGVAAGPESGIDPAAFALQDIGSERVPGGDDQPDRLIVSGELSNQSDSEQPAPTLQATLYDDVDAVLFSWTFALDRDNLDADESVRFSTSLDNAYPEATRLELSVVPE